ncbi:hypothetical protein DVH24_021268 [Malus domestica]|uniref:Uncharacterized protein n=1 Tax=Malus domestica TaxID=3750 RepID=A0A498HRB7_MALDO|nr:hypothetical protein DVH24_021268 [Malus domestica]
MMNDVRNYMSELNSKDAMIKELKMELESSHFLSMQLKLENEELSIMQVFQMSENTKSLSTRIEAMDLTDNQQLPMQTEVRRYKEMLEDLSKNELCFNY